jgi:hypothetical protein
MSLLFVFLITKVTIKLLMLSHIIFFFLAAKPRGQPGVADSQILLPRSLHCTALHCTALHCLHCTACTALHCTALHGTANGHGQGTGPPPQVTALHCTAPHTALQSQPWAAARAHGQPGVADSQITPPQVTALHCTATSCGIKISMDKLAKHIENVHHSQQMGVQCNKCKKEFNSSAILGNQMTRVYGNVSNPGIGKRI